MKTKYSIDHFFVEMCIHYYLLLLLLCPSRGAKYCDQSVCLFVCLFFTVRTDITGTTWPIFTKFFVHVSHGPVSVYSGSIAIRYVLPVFWVTYLAIMGCIAYFSTGAESHVYDCLVLLTFCLIDRAKKVKRRWWQAWSCLSLHVLRSRWRLTWVMAAGILSELTVRRTLCLNRVYHVHRFDRWHGSVGFILASCWCNVGQCRQVQFI